MKREMYIKIIFVFFLGSLLFNNCNKEKLKTRIIHDFGKTWKYHLGNIEHAQEFEFDDSGWRDLTLPHDWSVEGEFSEDHPATPGGGALPGGIGWYRKKFHIPESKRDKLVFIDFDGVYQNSEVWINGHHLGKRPNGYISFRYELTPFLKFGKEHNLIAVKVDNSPQPNSRWYTGSGIYRNVRIVITDSIFVDHWGTFVTTPEVNEQKARVFVRTKVKNRLTEDRTITLKTVIYNAAEREVATIVNREIIGKDSVQNIVQELVISDPILWSIERPYLYQAVSIVECNGKIYDDYRTSFGIRYFKFDRDKGFSLNGKTVKIKGVCNHHDLGCLGAAVNRRAIERQLEIMKAMGCNGIRTAHNPPAPELLELCDKMGFIVMDEAFDMWKKQKNPFDYHLYWEEWHKDDLQDMIRRDRNHPSVFIWSIGNEIMEQWDSTGVAMTRELVSIVKSLDTTRPVTSNFNDPNPSNYIIKSGVLDMIGYSYHHEEFLDFHKKFPGQKFIASETNSALATRGYYIMPSDSIYVWPLSWDKPFTGNPDYACSAYDNCRTPWGSLQNDTWRIVKKHDFLSGMYIWTGFDYLGEPTPYSWPARSSYFGIVDLAGFPKDSYYFYQSEWTEEPVLHIFPHWNWQEGDSVDVWAYSNCQEVELFLNGQSLGTRQKTEDILRFTWSVVYIPGILKAVARTDGKEILTKTVRTAGVSAKIFLHADRDAIAAGGKDLSFVTVTIVDQEGITVPEANNPVYFEIQGEGIIIGVDNGNQISHEPFKANYRRVFHGMCLVVVQSTGKTGTIYLKATSPGLQEKEIIIKVKNMADEM
jgi:beta-galactosidase